MKNNVKNIARRVTIEFVYEMLKEHFESLDGRIDKLEVRFMDMRTEMQDNFKDMRTDMQDNFKAQNARIDALYDLFLTFVKSQIPKS